MNLRVAVCIAIMTAACKAKSPMGLYCEGGVVDKHNTGTGECLEIIAAKPDAEATTIGTGVWSGMRGPADRYSVRRETKSKYRLYLNGDYVGDIDHDDNWIHVTFTSNPKLAATMRGATFRLRSDAPGVFL
jgi:hypothetical protein